MSDINLNLDGIVALLVAAALAMALLLGVVICTFYARARALQRSESFSRQAVFPHMIGMLLSVAGCLAIVLLIFLRDGHVYPHDMEQWLDHWLWLWAIAVLLLWPLSVLTMKRWRKAKLSP